MKTTKRFGIFYFLISWTFLLVTDCSQIPDSWEKAVFIKSVSPSSTQIFVEVEGYSPFTYEIYDNPFFEGNPAIPSWTVPDKSFTVSGLTDGTPYYLQVKSVFGKWTKYTSENNKPISIIPTSSTAGTVQNPFLISSQEDLIFLSNDISRWGFLYYFLLTEDIDLTGVNWKPIGNGTVRFNGYFDGGGHIISGLGTLENTGNGGYAGLFGFAGNPVKIKNLAVKIGNLTCANDTVYLGGLAGMIAGGGSDSSFKFCSVTGDKITGGANIFSAGGLIGISQDGNIIENCYTDILIEGKSQMGGLIGGATGNIIIRKSYAAGDLIYSGSGGHYVGGFVGYWATNLSNIENSLTLNNRIVNAPNSSGDFYFFGRSNSANPITAYYNRDIYCPEGSSVIFTGQYAQPINPYTISQTTPPFNNWDFSNDWKWDHSINRPVLRKVNR